MKGIEGGPSQGRFDVAPDGNVNIIDNVSVLPDGRPLVGVLADLHEADELWDLFVSRHELEDPERKQAIIDEVIVRSNILSRRLNNPPRL